MTVNVGEIRLLAGNGLPDGWLYCDGSPLSTSTYSALHAVIQFQYGGNGVDKFNLPDLRGRLPIHRGPGYALGFAGGAEKVGLSLSQIPSHGHPMYGTSTTATQATPSIDSVVAQSLRFDGYSSIVPGPQRMAPNAIGANSGVGDPHENLQPFLCINYIIAYVAG